MGTAVEDEVIDVNPCAIKGGSTVTRKRPITVLRTDDYALLVKAMPERYRAMVMLATWTALRFGELAELRRGDVDIEPDDSAGVLHVRRAVARTKGKVHRDHTKTEAGVRDVAIPPHLVPAIAEHLRDHVAPESRALLFPAPRGDNLHPTSLYTDGGYYAARESIGRPDLRFHDLRHTGAVLAAQSGATVADLMARLGHSTPAAAMRYQHTAAGRDALIAARMSEMMTGM
jgi:integrase